MEPFRLHPSRTVVPPSVFVARGAVVAGDVQVGERASIWFAAVVRGDTEAIRIGPRTNIQDGCVVHADPGFPCVLGADVTLGHRAVVHGARIGDETMVGMGAVVLNGATVGSQALIGAGALLVGGRDYPGGHLILGSPAKAVRPLTDEEIAGLRRSAQHYVEAGAAWRDAGWSRDDAGPGW